MIEIVIEVSGGLVQDVYSDSKDVQVTVLDYDTDEGQALAEKTDIPEHQVY